MATLKMLAMAVLVAALVSSALAVVYCKYQTRQLFKAIQQQESQLGHYEMEWGQLQIELTRLLAQNNIETAAKAQLGMVLPLREKIIYLEP